MSIFLKIPHNAEQEKDIRTSTGNIRRLAAISEGEETKKSKVFLSSEKAGNTREVGTFIKKEFTSMQRALNEAMKADRMRKVGLPVPNTIRYFEDDEGKPSLLISDLSVSGEKQVWSINNNQQELALSQDERDFVEERVKKIGLEAAKKGFMINADAYFIVKDGQNIEIVIGDFGIGVAQSNMNTEKTKIFNTRMASRFNNFL
ncbi:hypothetical protein COT52_01915 [candidate division WWE3 bacterium CG08_land_8_20_14_0_20_43_13]|uniref:Uncharacterized protein n=1 Tax=candidate division WWE3 bacterium CG08_land_8_20_14_0_20_43_13 TaxID=1975087 RepID=A0A2H0X753_UNCKA|nr:MAG: hypothetical protein COT52_01915 [candidate division WWE3 bacterium CG08_land_8_20_14_0_20_43_13]